MKRRRRKAKKMLTRTPHDWPEAGTLMKVHERDGECWDGPVIRVIESWKLHYGDSFTLEVRGIIQEPYDWPMPAGTPFTCYASDLEIVGPEPS